MTLAHLPSWVLATTAAASLGLAAFSPTAARLPLLAVAGGAATIAAARRRVPVVPRRVEVLARVAITPRTHAALLSVDGAGWLVVVGEGCAQLARAELATPASGADR